MATFDKGDKIRITATFTDTDGNATDPSTVYIRHKDPSGNEVNDQYGVGSTVKDDTGVYYLDVSIDEVGRWYYRTEGTGAVEASFEGHFGVRETQFTTLP